jgi:hypothetical protein
MKKIPETITIDVCYYLDENNKPVFDFEEMADQFERELSELDDSVVVMVSVE